MQNRVNIHLNLIWRNNNEPVSGAEYSVKFYDKDFVKDDFLGQSGLDTKGHSIISVVNDDYRSSDSFLEKYPDIYFIVMQNEDVIYKSGVYKNLHIEEANHFPASDGLHFNLGTFAL